MGNLQQPCVTAASKYDRYDINEAQIEAGRTACPGIWQTVFALSIPVHGLQEIHRAAVKFGVVCHLRRDMR